MSRPDRLPSDHPSVTTYRAQVARHGGRRLRLEVPAEIALPTVGEIVRVALDGEVRFARVDASAAGEGYWLTGVYDSPTTARDPSALTAPDRLGPWLRAHGRTAGQSVELDVIEPDYCIGVREPGERLVYPAVDKPSSSLADIANKLYE